MQHPIHQRSRTLPRRIADHFEQEIREGRLRENDRLPSTAELARSFGVNLETLQAAMKELAGRGLLERIPGRGTFIRHGLAGRCVGIVFGREIFYRPDRLFHAVLLEELTGLIRQSGWSSRLFASGEAAEYDKGFHDLKQAVSAGEIRIVLGLCANRLIEQYLWQACSVPAPKIPFELDVPSLLEPGLAYLDRHACREVLVLHSSAPEWRQGIRQLDPGRYPHLRAHFVPVDPHDADREQVYRTAAAFFPAHPGCDGLFITEDAMFRQAVTAACQSDRHIGGELKLITHVNKGLEPFFPLPLTRLEIDPADVPPPVWHQLPPLLRGDPAGTGLPPDRLVLRAENQRRQPEGKRPASLHRRVGPAVRRKPRNHPAEHAAPDPAGAVGARARPGQLHPPRPRPEKRRDHIRTKDLHPSRPVVFRHAAPAAD
nr:winged helix-turn-helix domain-containing protein [Victivallis vadensis]